MKKRNLCPEFNRSLKGLISAEMLELSPFNFYCEKCINQSKNGTLYQNKERGVYDGNFRRWTIL